MQSRIFSSSLQVNCFGRLRNMQLEALSSIFFMNSILCHAMGLGLGLGGSPVSQPNRSRGY